MSLQKLQESRTQLFPQNYLRLGSGPDTSSPWRFQCVFPRTVSCISMRQQPKVGGDDGHIAIQLSIHIYILLIVPINPSERISFRTTHVCSFWPFGKILSGIALHPSLTLVVLALDGHGAGPLVFLHDCVLNLGEKEPHSSAPRMHFTHLLAHGFSCVCYWSCLLYSSDLVRICLNISLPSFSSSLQSAIILSADNFTSKFIYFFCVESLFFYGTHTHNLLTSIFWSLNLLHFSCWEFPLNPMPMFCGVATSFFEFLLILLQNIISEFVLLSQEAAFSMELTVFFGKKSTPTPQNQKTICKGQGMRSAC